MARRRNQLDETSDSWYNIYMKKKETKKVTKKKPKVKEAIPVEENKTEVVVEAQELIDRRKLREAK